MRQRLETLGYDIESGEVLAKMSEELVFFQRNYTVIKKADIVCFPESCLGDKAQFWWPVQPQRTLSQLALPDHCDSDGHSGSTPSCEALLRVWTRSNGFMLTYFRSNQRVVGSIRLG